MRGKPKIDGKGLVSKKMPLREPWIGWGIIGLLLTVCGFFIVSWMKNIELKISEAERETAAIRLRMETEKGRLDSLAVQLGTVISAMDRMSQSYQSIDSRLTRMEMEGKYQRNNR